MFHSFFGELKANPLRAEWRLFSADRPKTDLLFKKQSRRLWQPTQTGNSFNYTILYVYGWSICTERPTSCINMFVALWIVNSALCICVRFCTYATVQCTCVAKHWCTPLGYSNTLNIWWTCINHDLLHLFTTSRHVDKKMHGCTDILAGHRYQPFFCQWDDSNFCIMLL